MTKTKKEKPIEKPKRYTFTLSFENENKKIRCVNTIAQDEKEARGHFTLLISEDFNYKASKGNLPEKCIIETVKGKKTVREYNFDKYYAMFKLLSVNKVSLYGDGGNKDLINGQSI